MSLSFVGFIKKEISRRLGVRYRLPGTFWQSRFAATALPTAESQLSCLKYLLSQGVKEDLVERPEHWLRSSLRASTCDCTTHKRRMV